MAVENRIQLGAEYFFDPTIGRPLFNGQIFIGQPDLDPEIEANRITVNIIQENGTRVPILPPAQPLVTGPGGGILYLGQIVTVVTDQPEYSIKALNSAGGQAYYFPSVKATNTVGEWKEPGLSATYISATSFSVPGNQTADYHSNRRVMLSGGNDRYASVSSSTFTTNTVVTVFNITDSLGVPQNLDVLMDTANISILSSGVTSSVANFYPLGIGETGVLNFNYDLNNILRFIPAIEHDSIINRTSTTDLSSYVQNWIDSTNLSGTRIANVGLYLFSNIIVNADAIRGLKIIGEGVRDTQNGGTLFKNNSPTTMFTTSGAGSISFFEFENLSFGQVDNTSGHIIAPAIANSVVFMRIENFYFSLVNPASSMLKIDGGNPALIKISRFNGFGATALSVPIFDIACAPGLNIFGLKFEDASFNSNLTATAPMIKIENKSGGQESFSVTIDDVNFETPAGGAIEMLSINRSVIRNSSIADLSPTIPTQSLIIFDKSTIPGSLNINDAIIENCTLSGGDNTFATVEMVALGGQGGLVMVNSKVSYLKGEIGTPIIIGSSIISNLVGTTKPLWLHTSGRISGIQGLSGSNIDSRNLSGTEIFPGANNISVVFTVPEIDDLYQVICTLDADGTVRVTDKLTTGFTIRSSIVASNDNVDWFLIRN